MPFRALFCKSACFAFCPFFVVVACITPLLAGIVMAAVLYSHQSENGD